jgi:ABC-type phosphate transport system substrate-binding protein
MKVRSRFRSPLWMLAPLAGALCCTQLESGGDRFGVTNMNGGSAGTAGASLVEAGSNPQTAGSSNGGVAGSDPVENTLAGAAGAGESGAGCTDDGGFDGLGCYRCAPTDIVTLENACSDSTCKPFDNAARLPLAPKGKLPALPTPSGAGGMAGSGGGGGTAGGGSGGAAGGGGGAGAPGVGFACDSLSQSGTVVYVTGSTAAKPFLEKIAQQLSIQDAKVFLVYTSLGSCAGVDAIVNGTLLRTGAAPLPASATYWESSASTGKPCDLPADGINADLGISDVFAQSCPGFELASLESLKIRDAHGPIQTMTFAVPSNSAYHEISQQAAYLVFGFGKDAQVLDPSGAHPIWNDEKSLLVRSSSSGTQAMLAAAIGVPPGQWKGQGNKSSDDVAGALQAATKTPMAADAAIGILGADYIDSRNLRAQIRALAFQDTHQACAVTPDSSETAKDKRNVRDGHYPVWGPLHLMYHINAKGEPASTTIREPLLDMVGYLSGTKPLPNGVSLFDVYALNGLVPECAMSVTRTQDGGTILPFHPESPCSCSFDVRTTGSTSCETCNVQGDCGAGESCSQGYCERN